MQATDYSAVIRTYRCDALLVEVIATLRAQTLPPSEIVIVDSSHDPATARQLAELGTVVAYPDEPFNYSKALNLGIAAATKTNVLLISSHIRLDAPDVIAAGVAEARRRGLDVLYWVWSRSRNPADDALVTVNRRNFDGTNGLSNACAFILRRLVVERPFREEVFSAEDQEWAKSYLDRDRVASVLRVLTYAFNSLNPHHRVTSADPNDAANTVNIQKLINEKVAIGYFVRRRMLLPDYIAARFALAAFSWLTGNRNRARLNAGIAIGLTRARFRKPKYSSKYF